MGRLSLTLAFAAFAIVLFPNGMYLAMAMAGSAAPMGWIAFRKTRDDPWIRLAGALGCTVALIAGALAVTRFVLTWWAVDRLGDIFG